MARKSKSRIGDGSFARLAAFTDSLALEPSPYSPRPATKKERREKAARSTCGCMDSACETCFPVSERPRCAAPLNSCDDVCGRATGHAGPHFAAEAVSP